MPYLPYIFPLTHHTTPPSPGTYHQNFTGAASGYLMQVEASGDRELLVGM